MNANKQTTNQIIAKEGYKSIALSVAFILVFIFVHLHILALITFILLLFFCFIFRNTERINPNRTQDVILAPCDGVIKDIIKKDNQLFVKIKIDVLDNGILRTPMFIDTLSVKYKHGFFIHNDDMLKKYLNTRHEISAFNANNLVYTMTLLPEILNKISIYDKSALFAGDRIGFMKYGYLFFILYIPCNVDIEKGQVIRAGETLLGRIV